MTRIRFNWRAFSKAVKSHRNVGLRTAAKQAGVHFATISRLETKHRCNLETAVLLSRWIGKPLDQFIEAGKKP